MTRMDWCWFGRVDVERRGFGRIGCMQSKEEMRDIRN